MRSNSVSAWIPRVTYQPLSVSKIYFNAETFVGISTIFIPIKSECSDVTGSKPGQVCFKDFWSHTLA